MVKNNIQYYDTHAHINISPLVDDVDKIIKIAIENKTIINCIGVDLKTSKKAIELARKYFGHVFACVGIHPKDGYQYIGDLNLVITKLEKIIIDNLDCIVAIGEIGLDYYCIEDKLVNIEFQKECFLKQLELAIKYNLPVNIHNRDADEDILEFLKKYHPKKVMIHCFNSSWISAKKFLDLNCYLSIPGIVTFKNAVSLKEAVKKIPIEKLVVETDCPFLTPVPYRGKTNFPYYVKYIVDEIAKIKNISVEIVKKQLLKNAIDFFNIYL